jgi:hypothetical protein
MARKRRSTWFKPAVGVGIAVAITLASWFAMSSNLFFRTQLRFSDGLFPGTGIDSRLMVVGIDDESIALVGRWPWDRSIHAQMIDNMAADGALLIGYDVTFASANAADPEGDRALADAIAAAGNVVLGETAILEPVGDPPVAEQGLPSPSDPGGRRCRHRSHQHLSRHRRRGAGSSPRHRGSQWVTDLVVVVQACSIGYRPIWSGDHPRRLGTGGCPGGAHRGKASARDQLRRWIPHRPSRRRDRRELPAGNLRWADRAGGCNRPRIGRPGGHPPRQSQPPARSRGAHQRPQHDAHRELHRLRADHLDPGVGVSDRPDGGGGHAVPAAMDRRARRPGTVGRVLLAGVHPLRQWHRDEHGLSAVCVADFLRRRARRPVFHPK